MEQNTSNFALKKVWSWILWRPIILMIIAYLVFVAISIPDFFLARNIRNYFIQSADIMIFSFGLLFVMMNGSIDFSSAAVIGMGSLLIAMITNSTSGWLQGSPWAVPLAIVVTIALSIGISLFNGLAVTRLKIPSFIATMSSNMILMGIALTVSMSATISGIPTAFTKIAKGSIGFLPNLVFITIIIGVVVAIVINRTEFGRRALSVGSNPISANISGLSVKKTIMQLFLINGILVGIGVILFTARMGVGKAGLGENRTLDFVASVIIGGTSPKGGSATVLGTSLGALFIMLIDNSLNMLGLTWYTIMIVKGFFVVAMALLDAYRRKIEQTN